MLPHRIHIARVCLFYNHFHRFAFFLFFFFLFLFLFIVQFVFEVIAHSKILIPLAYSLNERKKQMIVISLVQSLSCSIHRNYLEVFCFRLLRIF